MNAEEPRLAGEVHEFRTFAKASGALVAARGFVDGALAAIAPQARDVALLLASELATTAYRQAVDAFAIDVRSGEDGVRIEVSEDSGERPALPPPWTSSGASRSVDLIGEFADESGVIDDANHRAMWFALHGPGAEPSAGGLRHRDLPTGAI